MPFKIIIPLLLLLVSACSPHPGSGGWGATSEGALFERLEIRYNGQADFYTLGNDAQAAWRCFWGTGGATRVSLKCVDAGNSNNEQDYVFLVENEPRQGTLILGNQALGQYAWQPPTEAAED